MKHANSPYASQRPVSDLASLAIVLCIVVGAIGIVCMVVHFVAMGVTP